MADKCAVLCLKEALEKALSDTLCTENVKYFTSTPKLLCPCEYFIDTHAEDVIDSAAVVDMPKEIIMTLFALLVEDELHIFLAVQKWIERNHSKGEILTCVRVHEIKPEALEAVVLPTDEEVVVEAMRAKPRVRTRGPVVRECDLFDYVSPFSLIQWQRSRRPPLFHSQ